MNPIHSSSIFGNSRISSELFKQLCIQTVGSENMRCVSRFVGIERISYYQSQENQAIAAAMSARVNEALHHLSNPLRRAEYILACEGLGGEETDKLEDMELLMEVMEAREGLANAESEEEVAEIRSENQGTCASI